AFVPVVGAGLVWVPITIYWLLTGAFGKAVVLLVVGTLGISMVDYILRPIVIGNRTKMHTLLIFLSVLGGLGYFGFVGIVVGPMVALTCMALINMYVDTPGSRFLSGRGDEADWSP
ncbi:MAG: AI-2E family transporter, partial [Thermodesulfobacteriota bacterium]